MSIKQEQYEQGKRDGLVLGEILQEMKNMSASLIRIEGNLGDQEKRIATLENWRWYLAGSIIAGTAIPQIVKAFMQ